MARLKKPDVAKFKALIATPATSAFSLPGNAMLKIEAKASILLGADLLTLTGPTTRTIKAQAAMALGAKSGYVYAERGAQVTLKPNTYLKIDVGLGVLKTIGVGA